jgi:hypothetical protein
MRIRPGLFIAIAAVFGVLFAGRYLGWFGKSRDTVQADSTATTTPEPTEVTISTPPPPPPSPTPPPFPPPPAPGAARAAIPPPPAAAAAPTATGPIADWEQRIDDVLTGKEDEAQKAKRLLEIFPHLPPDGQVEAAQHLSNLLPDDQYEALAQTLTNALTSEEVLDVLMTDVLNRPNQIKLSTLLDIARNPAQPKAGEARDVLEVFVDEDYGENWIAWNEAIQKWLKENPDE